MHALVKYDSKYYTEILKELKNQEITPVFLFKIDFNDKQNIKLNLEKIKEIKKENKIKYSAIQITIEKPDNNLVSAINSLKQDFDIIIGLGGLNKINRFFLEETQVDFLQDPQNSLFNPKIDFIHHFNSGINEVLCKFAKEKEIGFLFSLNFLNNKTKYMAKELGRVDQNIVFAQKYKIPFYFNYIIEKSEEIKSKQELMWIMSLFSINNENKSLSLITLKNKIDKNILKKSPEYINSQIKFKT